MTRPQVEAALARVVATESWRIDPAVRHADVVVAVLRLLDLHGGNPAVAAHDAAWSVESIRPYRSRDISAQLAVLREMARST